MIYRNRHVRSLRDIAHWVKAQVDVYIPDGQILILSGATLVILVLAAGLIGFFQNTSQIESQTLNMMQGMRNPSDWADVPTENPLLQNLVTGGFVMFGMIALGAILVCLDRLKQHFEISDWS